jgi:hypothetical protein
MVMVVCPSGHRSNWNGESINRVNRGQGTWMQDRCSSLSASHERKYESIYIKKRSTPRGRSGICEVWMTMGFDCGMTNWIGLEMLTKSNRSDLPDRPSVGVSSGVYGTMVLIENPPSPGRRPREEDQDGGVPFISNQWNPIPHQAIRLRRKRLRGRAARGGSWGRGNP